MQTFSILSRIDFIEGTIMEVERVLADQKRELAELRSMLYSETTICGNSKCGLCDPTCARQVLCRLASCPRMAQLMENQAQQQQRSMHWAPETGGSGAPGSFGDPNPQMFPAPETLASRLERIQQQQFPRVAQTAQERRAREQELYGVREERADRERSERKRAGGEKGQQQRAGRGMASPETSWPPADLIMDLENAPASVRSLAVALMNGFRLVTTDISRAKIGYRAAPGGHEVESFCPAVGISKVFVGYDNSSHSPQVSRPAARHETSDTEMARFNRLVMDLQGFRDRFYAGMKRDAGKE